jgi:hypothetical protein
MTKADFPSGDELDDMVRDLGREMGVPYPIFPELVDLDTPAEESWMAGACFGGHGGDGLTRWRETQEWRRKIIAELEKRPAWIAAWRAEVAHDKRIEALCKTKGYRFAPHELTPWEVPSEGDSRYAQGTGGSMSWAKAQKLRRQLERELAAQDAAASPRKKARA